MALGDLVASRRGCQNEIMARARMGSEAPPLSALNHELETDKGVYIDAAEAVQDTEGEAIRNRTATCISPVIYFSDARRSAYESSTSAGPAESGLVSKWRMKDRMKTGSVALVLCLNIGVDPPDIIKISPCARMECWIDPFSISPQKALDAIGKTLQAQYERWQPRARYKVLLDPTAEDIKKLCNQCRKGAKSERVLFHYNGHGVPKPTLNGEIWLFNKSYTQYIPLSVYELESWLGTPSICVFDCSAAGMILDAFCERPEGSFGGSAAAAMKDCILLAACGSLETLPQISELPADVFTSCLTTPIKIALRWFCRLSLLRDSLDPNLIDKIPGRQNDRKTPLGELNWIFTSITDTIAWNVLPRDLFQRLFRQDLLVASLFRNFLLAERIMKTVNCCPRSYPRLPPTHKHPMWQAWDMAAEICLSQLPALLNNSTEFQPSPFFTEQLTAFEVWLEHGSERKKPPEQLPIVLQVLLSQSHRFRALFLLGRFLDMGAWAVDLALSVGIFPYVLKLLQTTATELRQILVFIWTKILALDKSCQVDLVKDGGHQYFIKFLDSPDIYPEQRAMAAFALAVIVDGHRKGQEECFHCGLVTICLQHIRCSSKMDALSEPLLRRWLCLCLGKLWDGFLDAQQQGLQANAHSVLMQLLSEPHPEVRAAATFALGTLIAAGNTEIVSDAFSQDDDYEDEERQRADQEIGSILLKVLYDGSPLVRAELAIGLSRLAIAYNKLLKPIAAAQSNPPSNSVLPAQTQRGASSVARNHSPGLRVVSDRVMPFHVSLSSPSLATSVIMQSSPTLGGLSYPPEGSRLLLGNGSIGKVASRQKEEVGEESTFYVRCFQAICVLQRDPSPYVSCLARQVLRNLGVERTVVNSVGASSSTSLGAPAHTRDSSTGSVSPAVLSAMPRSFSWIDSPSGNFSVTFPPASPPTGQSVLAINGMRRVCSLEFSPHMRKTADTGLADTALVGGGPSLLVENVPVPCSNLYRWSCTHFSRPLLETFNDDGNEEAVVRREERERLALDGIFKCQHSNVTKCSEEIASWDIKPPALVDYVLLHPFAPIVCAADHQEVIRVWDYEAKAVVNTFDNHRAPDKGVAKMFLLNELDDTLLLVASNDGCARVWKDYCQKGEQQLVTAWQTLQWQRPCARNVNAMVDWQQLRGYLYATGDNDTICVWDLNQELVLYNLLSESDSTISALSSHQGQCNYVTAGYCNGSARVFDTRSRDLACLFAPHRQKVVGISFLPGIDSSKIVSASVAGDLKFIDVRQPAAPYMDKGAPPYGPLSVMAVHRHAPLIATGSPKQMIKVYNLQGEQLSVMYRNSFNSFLGQGIGPVCALSFHPYKIYLAAGDAESNVAIFS